MFVVDSVNKVVVYRQNGLQSQLSCMICNP